MCREQRHCTVLYRTVFLRYLYDRHICWSRSKLHICCWSRSINTCAARGALCCRVIRQLRQFISLAIAVLLAEARLINGFRRRQFVRSRSIALISATLCSGELRYRFCLLQFRLCLTCFCLPIAGSQHNRLSCSSPPSGVLKRERERESEERANDL